jgi:hypothetical protein
VPTLAATAKTISRQTISTLDNKKFIFIMFKDRFNFELVRDTKKALGFYLTFWLITMIGSLLFSLPTIVTWGSVWHATPNDYFKFIIVGTHAICAVFSFYLSLTVAKAKNVGKSKIIIGLSLLGSIISGFFASPTTPILATVLTTIDKGQMSINKKQIIVFSILLIFSAVIYIVSAQMNKG